MDEQKNVEVVETSIMDIDSGFVGQNETTSFLKTILRGLKWFFTHRNFKYSMRRLLTGFITLALVAGAVFLLLRMVPRDGYYDKGILQKINTQAGKESYKAKVDSLYGFDKPLLTQVGNFYWDILPIPRTYITGYRFKDTTFTELIPKGEITRLIYLGESITTVAGEEITTILKERIPTSFRISILATLISYLFAYPLGVYMAKRKGKTADKLGNAFIVLNLAIPGLVFYFVLKSLFSSIHITESITLGLYNADYPILTILPAIFCISFLAIPSIAMWVRRFMVDEGDADYVKFARSKGLSENKIMYTHVLRNAIVPLVRNFPAAFVGAIIGSYFVEMIWNIPGTGILLISALNPSHPDNPVVQSLVIVYAAISMISYILGDICTVIVDPRIKLK